MTLLNSQKWQAIIQCDSSYDGTFFYGVKTTGIFCRPSCKSKKPLQSNVVFFDDISQAFAFGLRPCKRCRPDVSEYRPIQELLQQAKSIFDSCFADKKKLSSEIKQLGISQNYLIYLFRQQFAITPVGYINSLRVEKAARLLSTTDLRIINIAMLCGFGSLSTFHEVFKRQIGKTPSEFRNALR